MYINGNQTFILDSHRPFICSAALYVMVLMRADPLRRQVGGGLALEIEGPVKWHRAIWRVSFGAQQHDLCGKAIQVTGNEARNIAVNVAVIQKKLVAMIFAKRSGMREREREKKNYVTELNGDACRCLAGFYRRGQGLRLVLQSNPFSDLLFTFCMYLYVYCIVLCLGWGGGGTVR